MIATAHHSRLWTLDEVMGLADDGLRYELIDGVLIANPPPTPRHQSASFEFHRILDEAAVATRSPVYIYEGVGVRMPDENLLVPDLVITSDTESHKRTVLEPGEIDLAVEIVSPGSRRRDRSVKPYMYAEAGIPHYWRIETDNFHGRDLELPVIARYELVDLAEYRVVETVGAGETLRVDDPVPVSFDPARLIE